jgi:hypothetical protein
VKEPLQRLGLTADAEIVAGSFRAEKKKDGTSERVLDGHVPPRHNLVPTPEPMRKGN